MQADEAAADEAEMTAAFAATGASPGQQSIWRSTYRWLRGLPSESAATSAVTATTATTVDQRGEMLASLSAELTMGETEPVRVGAAYQLAEFARVHGDDAGGAEAVRVLCEALASGAESTGLRGIHGSAEHLMRAASYGLGAAGQTAVSPLLAMLEKTQWSDGSSAACARRILHALGEAAERPTVGDVAAVDAAYDRCCAELEQYGGSLVSWPLQNWDEESEAAGASLLSHPDHFQHCAVQLD